MPRGRPGSYTTFAILNFIVGGFALLCAVCAGIEPTMQVNNRDVTQQMHDFLSQQISGYMAYRVTGLVVGLLVGVGLIVAGVGLLTGPGWGRILAIAVSAVGVLHHIGLAIFQLFVVNPALDRFFSQIAFFGGFLAAMPKSQMWMAGIWEMLIAVYFVVQILVLAFVSPRAAARAQYEDEYEDRPRRPSRRPRDEEDYDEPRRPRRRRDWDEEDER